MWVRTSFFNTGSSQLSSSQLAHYGAYTSLSLSSLLIDDPLPLYHLQYVATTINGDHIAVAGRAGFAVYLQRRRRWKLFGSEMQEQGMVCRGGLDWYKSVVVFPCRVQDRTDEVSVFVLTI